MAEIIRPPQTFAARKISEKEFQERLGKAESSIDRMALNYHLHAEEVLSEALSLLAQAEQAPDQAPDKIKAIFTIVHDIKGQAKGFGYPLLGEIAAPLADLVRDPGAVRSPMHFKVVRAHLEAGLFVVKKQIAGDGGEAGRKLIDRLATAAQVLG